MAIPSGITVPGSYIEIDNSRAIDPYATDVFRVCIFGEHPTKGVNDAIQYQRILSPTDAFAKYGQSLSFELCRSYFRSLTIGAKVEVYCVSTPVAVGSTITLLATLPTPNTITLTMPSTLAAGTLRVVQNGEEYFIPIVATDAVADIVEKIVTASGNVASVVGGATSGTSALTWTSTGISTTAGGAGEFAVEFTSYEDGPMFEGASFYKYTFEAAGDAATIDLSTYIALLPDHVINLFVNPYTDTTNYGLLNTEIERRFGPTVQLEGHQIICRSGTASSLITELDSYNEEHTTMWIGGYNRPCPEYLQSASVAGIMSSSLSEDPAVPMMRLDLVGVVAELQANEYQFEELNALIIAGGAVGQVDSEGNVETLRLTTTYTETSGLADESYRDANTIFTTSYLRQSLLRLIAVTYNNYKLADNGIRARAGQKIATPKKITLTILSWFVEMESRAIVENYDDFKTQLVVVRNNANGGSDATRVDAIIPPDVVNQFRIFGGSLQFIL